VPAVHVSGWYDFFVRGTIEAFVGYQTLGGPRARGKQKLVLGAWDHGLEGNKVGEVHLPAHAATPPNQMSDPTRWFDHWLKGMDNGVEREPAVTYYVMGDTTDSSAPGNVWRTTDAWPPRSEVTPFYLHTDQSLSRLRPTATDSTGDSLEYKYDPQDPVPTLGGQNLTLPSGPWDQRRIETRPDVLTFSSDRLDQAMEITGGALAVLWVGSDRPDTDFVVRLCDVYPDGRSLNICEGILRARFRESFAKPALMKPSEVYRIEVALGPTSIVINRGHRLRVQVTSSNAPACDPNPNTGLTGRADDGGVVARNRIFVDARRPSHIQVPVVPFCQSK
jgi:putative CocE/NonD family hydrolase